MSKWVRIIVATAIITMIEVFINLFTSAGVFNWVYEAGPLYIWKAMDEVGFLTYGVVTLILNFIFVLLYSTVNKGIPCENKYFKGLFFGLFVWGIGVLPEMFTIYNFITLNTTIIAYWVILSSFILIIKGFITSVIYGE